MPLLEQYMHRHRFHCCCGEKIREISLQRGFTRSTLTTHTHTREHSTLTINIQHHDFIVRRCQVGVAGDAHEPGVQMLPADVRIGQMIDRCAVRADLVRLVDHRVVQVPGHVWPGSTWQGKRTTKHTKREREFREIVAQLFNHSESVFAEQSLPPFTSQISWMSLPSLYGSTMLVFTWRLES